MSPDDQTVGELLQGMGVAAESPDGSIWARVRDYTKVEVGFRAFAFDRYDEPTLAYQLSRLGILTWVAWSRERTQLYRRSLNLSAEEARNAERTDDPHRRRYEAELNAIRAEGTSMHGTIRVNTVGMMQWHVEIQPGTLHRLGEEPFVNEIQSAFASLLQDRELKIITLKGDYFDLGIPQRWRDVMNEARAINRRTAAH
jgi:hypothetical protein